MCSLSSKIYYRVSKCHHSNPNAITNKKPNSITNTNIADDPSKQLSQCGETQLQADRRGAVSRGNLEVLVVLITTTCNLTNSK